MWLEAELNLVRPPTTGACDARQLGFPTTSTAERQVGGSQPEYGVGAVQHPPRGKEQKPIVIDTIQDVNESVVGCED